MDRTHAASGHLPVMYAQVLEGLRVVGDGTYLDGTFGRGGHARGVLAQLGPKGKLLVMDKDPEAIAVAEREFGSDARVAIFRGSFAELAQWPATAEGLDGVLFDLGVSSPQLDKAERGFSFGKDGPLDMRMDPDSGESAAQWLARADDRDGQIGVLQQFERALGAHAVVHRAEARALFGQLAAQRALAGAVAGVDVGLHPVQVQHAEAVVQQRLQCLVHQAAAPAVARQHVAHAGTAQARCLAQHAQHFVAIAPGDPGVDQCIDFVASRVATGVVGERGVGGEIGMVWTATPKIHLQGHLRYTSVGEIASEGSEAFDSDVLVGVNGRWYVRPNIALVTGYEFGKITTVNVGVRYSF